MVHTRWGPAHRATFKRDGGRPAAELSADGRGPLSVSLSPPPKPNSFHPTPPHSGRASFTYTNPTSPPAAEEWRSRPLGCRGRGGTGRGTAGGVRRFRLAVRAPLPREPKGLLGGGGVPGAGGIVPMAFCPASCQHYVRLSSGVRLQLATCVT